MGSFAQGGPARQNFSMGRRAFLKLMGAAGAGIGAAKAGLGSLFKGSKPIVKDLTSIPIENAEGMPAWFKPLVNRVIKEGVETTKLPPNKGGAYLDRQIVHSAKLGEGQGVRVYQNLDDQTIRVEYQSADNMGGVDDAVHLEYKAPQEIPIDNEVFKNLPKGKSSAKTKPEFLAEEAFPRGTTGDYKDITFDGSNTVKEVKDLYSDTSALKQFGTNKALTKKELEIAKQKRQRVNEINNDLSEQSQLLPEPLDYDDFASGGRVPMFLGGGFTAGKGLLRQILRHHEKTGTTGLKGSEMLKLINPKQFNEMLNRPEGIPSIAREMIKKYKKEMKADRIRAVDHSLGLAKKMKKGKINIAEMKEQAIKDLVEKKGLDKKMVEDLIDIFGAQKIKELPKITDEGILELETILKNLSTEGRKLNASGGVARLLGE
jgi:predicted GNAT family acetyltransferase